MRCCADDGGKVHSLDHYRRPFLAAQRIVAGNRDDSVYLELIDSERHLVLTIAAGNYGGNLGKFHFHLRKIMEEAS